MQREGGAIPGLVQQQAAEWLLELQADTADDSTRARWREWRTAHPDHERAWQRVEAFGQRLQAVPAALAHATLTVAREGGDPAHPRQRRRAIQTLAVLVFGGGAAWVLRDEVAWSPWVAGWAASEHTGPGERRSLTLADGSVVEMNAGTTIDIRYGDRERLVRLVQGEILVTTAHDPVGGQGRSGLPGASDAAAAARPFVVETPHGRIRALGTRFAVRRLDGALGGSAGGADDADASRVSVYEGAVAIRPRSSLQLDGWGALGAAPPETPGHLLLAGESARFTPDRVAGTQSADPTATAWTRGMIVAQDMPLVEFAAELNRQAAWGASGGSAIGNAGRWVCEPAAAQFKVTGTYPLADPHKVLQMLQTALPIRAHVQRRWWGGVQVVLAERAPR